MWIWTLDGKLLNSAAVECVQVVEVEGHDVDTGEQREGFELIASLTSGGEAVLFHAADEDLAHAAMAVVADFLGAVDIVTAFEEGLALSLSALVPPGGKIKAVGRLNRILAC